MSVVIFLGKMRVKKNWLKKVLGEIGKISLVVGGVFVVAGTSVVAQDRDPFSIIPSTPEDADAVETDFERTRVWEQYNEKLDELEELDDEERLAQQIGSGVMGRETLLDYLVFLVRFLSQLGLAIGGVMIIYAGYLYATRIFSDSGPQTAKKAISRAIVGIFVIASSYAIIQILTNAFL